MARVNRALAAERGDKFISVLAVRGLVGREFFRREFFRLVVSRLSRSFGMEMAELDGHSAFDAICIARSIIHCDRNSLVWTEIIFDKVKSALWDFYLFSETVCFFLSPHESSLLWRNEE